MEIKKHLPKIAVGLGLTAIIVAIASNGKKATNNDGYLSEYGTDGTINAKEIATVLYDAMKTINITNTEKNETIINALANVTPPQFGAIIKAFGLKAYNPYTGNTYQFLGFKLKKHSLPFWLKSELNNPEIKLLKTRFSQYF